MIEFEFEIYLELVHFSSPTRVLEHRVELRLEFPAHRLKVLVPFVFVQIVQIIYFLYLSKTSNNYQAAGPAGSHCHPYRLFLG
jgi:hypothetical protein